MKIPASVIIMTKNEERNIKKCLRSVDQFDEVFVIDSDSDDATCDIASRMGAKVVNFSWDGKYPKKKQWCLKNLPFTHDWVLYVDADEEVGDELSEEIRQTLKSKSSHTGYFVGYDYVFLDRKLKYGHRVYKLVLFRRDKGRFLDYDDLSVVNMWEVEGHYQPQLDGSTNTLSHRMLHDDHDNLFHFYEKLNKYSDWEAMLRNQGTLRHSHQAIISSKRRILQWVGDRVPFRGLAMFLYAYVFKLGFLDGRPGLYYALSLGIYHSLINMKVFEVKLQATSDG